MARKYVSRLTKAFSSIVMSGLALVSSHSWAQDANPEESADNAPPPTPLVESTNSYAPPSSQGPDTRRIDEKEDDVFSRRYKVHVSRENLWVSPPQRYDATLLPLPKDGLLDVTREYIEFRPLKKEWYGRSTGIEYGIRANINTSSPEWDFRTGLTFGYYHGRPEEEKEQGRWEGRDHNTRTHFYVEGARSVTLGDTSANLIAGVSFNRVSGPDIGNEEGTRVYTQMDFPALFSKPSNPNDSFSLGAFSGTVQAYAGTDTYGGKLGVYFNNLKDDGKGVNFSAGPEVRYDQRGGVSFHFKVRVAPKFW